MKTIALAVVLAALGYGILGSQAKETAVASVKAQAQSRAAMIEAAVNAAK